MKSLLMKLHLLRMAIIYIRQSSLGQVLNHKESQRLQYLMEEQARRDGFANIVIIDEDLGLSGSGAALRKGFEWVVQQVAAGLVGAIYCTEISRLSRNGREWHTLLELCAMFNTLIIDTNGMYDPKQMDDHLMLGIKGSLAGYELGQLRQRALMAEHEKAKRGELKLNLPVGMVWTTGGGTGLNPDGRVQEAIRLVFSKFEELGSVRRVWAWLQDTGANFPRHGGCGVEWTPVKYYQVLSTLKNPSYAGAYAYGRTGWETVPRDGALERRRLAKTIDEWEVLIKDHHPGYISWAEYERNQQKLSENQMMKAGVGRRSGLGGPGLLTGLLRCARCGTMLYVKYRGAGAAIRYYCLGFQQRDSRTRCLSFGGGRVEDVVFQAMSSLLEAPAVEAALTASEQVSQQREAGRRALARELEQARRESKLAQRRYYQVDPSNSLVVPSLELRWNQALERELELEQRINKYDAQTKEARTPDRGELLALAQDLPAAWAAAGGKDGIKQRIIRILIKEIVVDVDADRKEVSLVIHWCGGRHSEHQVPIPPSGRRRRCLSEDQTRVVRHILSRWPAAHAAAILNRMSLSTGSGKNWTVARVHAYQKYHKLDGFDPAEKERWVTMAEAAERLGISRGSVRKMIQQGTLDSFQITRLAPIEIPAEALENDSIREAANLMRGRGRRAGRQAPSPNQRPLFKDGDHE